jgi:hypothetical protein
MQDNARRALDVAHLASPQRAQKGATWPPVRVRTGGDLGTAARAAPRVASRDQGAMVAVACGHRRSSETQLFPST